jgi:hypothetical protein
MPGLGDRVFLGGHHIDRNVLRLLLGAAVAIAQAETPAMAIS